jgi:hypothetical protein
MQRDRVPIGYVLCSYILYRYIIKGAKEPAARRWETGGQRLGVELRRRKKSRLHPPYISPPRLQCFRVEPAVADWLPHSPVRAQLRHTVLRMLRLPAARPLALCFPANGGTSLTPALSLAAGSWSPSGCAWALGDRSRLLLRYFLSLGGSQSALSSSQGTLYSYQAGWLFSLALPGLVSKDSARVSPTKSIRLSRIWRTSDTARTRAGLWTCALFSIGTSKQVSAAALRHPGAAHIPPQHPADTERSYGNACRDVASRRMKLRWRDRRRQ